MLVLGLLILAAAVVAAVELIIANDAQITFSMWNQTWTIHSYWLAAIGAGIVVAGLLGLMLMRMGASRMRRIRRQRLDLEAENRRLAERAAKAPAAAPATRTAATVPTNSANADYPSAPAYPADATYGVPATGAAPAPEDTEEQHGFFARHATSGRRGH